MTDSTPAARRRFVPTPVETTIRSNRKLHDKAVETNAARSNQAASPANRSPDQTDAKKARACPPEPLEMSVRSDQAYVANFHVPSSSPRKTPSSGAPQRRFAPQLIETVKRIKRAGDSVPATLPTDKTDITPGTKHIYLPRQKPSKRPLIYPTPPDNTPNASGHNVPRLPPRREGSMKPHLNTRQSTRQDSFRSELEAIASDDDDADDDADEEDNDSSHSPSVSSAGESCDDSMRRLHLARTRESCDDRFSGYLLALAAKAAEKQLREQALAAFPNESVHEVVEHFYDREIEGASEDDEVITGIGQLPPDAEGNEGINVIHVERRATEIGWALKEMQQHQEKLQKMREDERQAEADKPPPEAQQPAPFPDPFWTHGMSDKLAAAAAVTGATEQEPQKQFELAKMQKAASPPMLGADLVFRRLPSPQSTKMETDQRHNVLPNRSVNGGVEESMSSHA